MHFKTKVIYVVLALLTMYGCGGTFWMEDNLTGPANGVCDEYKYWEEVSDISPYPGIGCSEGLTKSVNMTFFVHKDYENNNYISNESSIASGVELINSVYNPHGINFNVDEIVYIDSPFPSTSDYGEHLSISNLSQDIKDKYNYNNLNVVLITDEWGASGIFPWTNTNYYIVTFKASSIETSFIPSHEVGHFLGLHHTFASYGTSTIIDGNNGLTPAEGNSSPTSSSPENWVSPEDDCFTTGDFICDTSYDCYNYCEEVLGCSGAYLYEGYNKPGQEQSEYDDCELTDYTPPTDNLMSYYGDRQFITEQQGARARFYLMYKSTNNLNGNILHLYNQ